MKRWIMFPVVGLLALGTTACDEFLFEDPDHTYDGPPMVEFAPVTPAGNYVRTITFTRTATTDQSTAVQVNYVAPSPSADITGDITRVSTSTAVEGTHYRITGGMRYTIRAGTNSIAIPIDVLNTGLAPGATVTLVLELVPGTGYQVSTKYKTFTLTLRRTA